MWCVFFAFEIIDHKCPFLPTEIAKNMISCRNSWSQLSKERFQKRLLSNNWQQASWVCFLVLSFAVSPLATLGLTHFSICSRFQSAHDSEPLSVKHGQQANFFQSGRHRCTARCSCKSGRCGNWEKASATRATRANGGISSKTATKVSAE